MVPVNLQMSDPRCACPALSGPTELVFKHTTLVRTIILSVGIIPCVFSMLSIDITETLSVHVVELPL